MRFAAAHCTIGRIVSIHLRSEPGKAELEVSERLLTDGIAIHD